MNISLVGGEFMNKENNFKEEDSQTIEIGKYDGLTLHGR